MPSRLSARRMPASTRRMVLALGAGVTGLCLLLASPIDAAGAERLRDRGSQEDQAACTPDVFRFCLSQIPDEPRIVACLVKAKAQLSPGCRAVFDREATSTAEKAEPHRTTKSGKTRNVKPPTETIVRRGKREG